MRAATLLCFVACLLALGCAAVGCSVPNWRVFQARIDPKLAEKPAAQIEGERRAAALIVDLSFEASPDPIARIAEIHALAMPLSASLGEPLQRAKPFEAPAVIAEMRAGLVAAQGRADQWKAFARKYANKPIEDTGINLAGPMGALGLAGVVAACIFVPGFGWMLLRLLPVLWGAVKRGVQTLEDVAAKAPEAVAEAKAALPQREDATRRLIRLAKRRADLATWASSRKTAGIPVVS